VGLANAQGTVLSLVDVRPLLGLASAAWQWPLRAQVVDGQARVAIAVEEILGFDAFDPDHLEPLGEEVPEGLRSFGQGVLALPAGPAVLLDLPAIVEALKLRRPHRPSDDPGGEPTS
jgi:chemotaxis signal transduction protein